MYVEVSFFRRNLPKIARIIIYIYIYLLFSIQQYMENMFLLELHIFAEISQKLHALNFTFTFTFTFFSSLYNSMENMFLLELHIFAEISEKMILKCRHVYFNWELK